MKWLVVLPIVSVLSVLALGAYLMIGWLNSRRFPEQPHRPYANPLYQGNLRGPRIEIVTDPVEKKAAMIAAGVERAK